MRSQPSACVQPSGLNLNRSRQAGATLFITVVFCAVPLKMSPKIDVFSRTCFVRDSSSRVSYRSNVHCSVLRKRSETEWPCINQSVRN